MEPISKVAQKELIWTQPNAFKEEYELRGDDVLVGTLKFRSAFGSLAIAETADGCWTFKRVGFFSTRVSVRACDSETDIASFKNSTWSGGGTLELPNGRTYRASTNFWQTKLELISEYDQLVLSYSDIGGFFRRTAMVQIEQYAAQIADLPWMVMLSWYLVVMMQRDSAAAATAAASY
ncbi:MAG: hypothetical protein ACYC6H_03300 [Bellilinea sp.]